MDSPVLRFVLVLAITVSVVQARATDMGLKIKRSTDQEEFRPTKLEFPVEMRKDFRIVIEGEAPEDETFETSFVFTNTVLEDGTKKYVTEYCNITLEKMKVTVLPGPIGKEKGSVYTYQPDDDITAERAAFSIHLVMGISQGVSVKTIYKDMSTSSMICSIKNINDIELAYIRFEKGRPLIKAVSFKFGGI